MIEIQKIKGVHPGLILNRELKKRKLKKGPFALSIDEYPQTLGSITKGMRKMNTALSLKIEKKLGIEEGYFMILQALYDIEKYKEKNQNDPPDLKKFRSSLFWDTEIKKINWQKQKRAVIKRVFTRGNDIEKAEIVRFYGKETVDEILD